MKQLWDTENVHPISASWQHSVLVHGSQSSKLNDVSSFPSSFSSLCPTGYFTQISTLADVQENVMEYLHVLSRPKVIDREHDTVWTEAYIDSTVSWYHDLHGPGFQFPQSLQITQPHTDLWTQNILWSIQRFLFILLRKRNNAPKSTFASSGWTYLIQRRILVIKCKRRPDTVFSLRASQTECVKVCVSNRWNH